MQNRMGWVMATLAVACLVAALGVALNGWRTTPPVDAPPVSSATGNPQDVDPLAPRLFDQSGPIRIHVAGAVRKPGVYSIPA
ncbi:MAG TPA: hypothetical protein VK689_20185, partial [Armatimonadota bacterium]|nr:hypothetical protein [Armatimonadota bacterium]